MEFKDLPVLSTLANMVNIPSIFCYVGSDKELALLEPRTVACIVDITENGNYVAVEDHGVSYNINLWDYAIPISEVRDDIK